jgi:hypothetical protein
LRPRKIILKIYFILLKQKKYCEKRHILSSVKFMAIKTAASVRSTKEKEKVKLQFRNYSTSILAKAK